MFFECGILVTEKKTSMKGKLNNMKIFKGIDVGNGYCKYKGGRFASKVKHGNTSSIGNKRKNLHQVIYNNKEFVAGDGGTFTGKNRYYTEEYEIALLTAIALASGNKVSTIQANVVVGLPVDHYKKMSDDVQEHLSNLGVKEINVDGDDYIIEIESANVFIEGAYPIAYNDDSHMITIDIGAGTINVIEWENQAIINKFTFDKAFYEVHKRIAEFLNENYSLGILPADAEKYVGKKVIETEDGEVEVPEIGEIVGNFISETATTIENSFHTTTCKSIKVFGGGAKDTFPHWKKHFKKAELVKDSQHVNQSVYEAVAESMAEAE